MYIYIYKFSKACVRIIPKITESCFNCGPRCHLQGASTHATCSFLSSVFIRVTYTYLGDRNVLAVQKDLTTLRMPVKPFEAEIAIGNSNTCRKYV